MVLLCNRTRGIPKASGEFSMWWPFSQAEGLQQDSLASHHQEHPGEESRAADSLHAHAWCHQLHAAVPHARSLPLPTAGCSPEPLSSLWDIFLAVVCIGESAVLQFLKDNNAMVWPCPWPALPFTQLRSCHGPLPPAMDKAAAGKQLCSS